jgi:hypothetical protein
MSFDPFEDLGLKYIGLANIGFPTSLIKVTHRDKTLGGFNVGSAFRVRTSGIKVGDIKGTLTPSYEVKDLNMMARITLDTENTAKLALEFTNPAGLENSKLRLSYTQAVVRQEITETAAQGDLSCIKGNFGVRVGGGAGLEHFTAPNASATVFVQNPANVYWSTTGNILTDKENKLGLANLIGKVSHITPNTEGLLSVMWNRTSEVTYSTSWFQRLSPRTTYGVQFATSVGGEVMTNTSAVVVGEFELDATTTIRAKSINANAGPRMQFGISQKIAQGCTATVGVDMNARHLFDTSSTGLPHSIGFQIDII